MDCGWLQVTPVEISECIPSQVILITGDQRYDVILIFPFLNYEDEGAHGDGRRYHWSI